MIKYKALFYLASHFTKRRTGFFGIGILFIFTSIAYWNKIQRKRLHDNNTSKKKDHQHCIFGVDGDTSQDVRSRETTKNTIVAQVHEPNTMDAPVTMRNKSMISEESESSSGDEEEVCTPENEDYESLFDNATIGSLLVDTPDKYTTASMVTDYIPTDTFQIESVMKDSSLPSRLKAGAPEFVPKALRYQKKNQMPKQAQTFEELLVQQKQQHVPKLKSRCSHWPRCTNKHCKFVHPYKPCRAGNDCVFGEKCMFLHSEDYQ